MVAKKLELINECTSPLFRIMSVYNPNGANRAFTNNVCAFHVGNGLIVSVAHSVSKLEGITPVVSANYFQHEILDKLDGADRPFFEQVYSVVEGNQRFSIPLNQTDRNTALQKLTERKVDRRYSTLYSNHCCSPYLVLSFRDDAFCGDPALRVHFSATRRFHESPIKRFTFLLKLDLLESFESEDLAIYRIVDTHQDVINKLPVLPINFTVYDTGIANFFCLQPAPYDNIGRMINEVTIEGLVDNFAQENNGFTSTILEGLRYLVKGYFRFGSSGAPYIVYDNEQETFAVNAVQSQASYIQFSINNKMDGNRQYVNGVATPLYLIQSRLEKLITNTDGFTI